MSKNMTQASVSTPMPESGNEEGLHKGEIEDMKAKLWAKGKVKIMVLDDPLNKQSDHIVVGINGVNFQIKRGVPVEVPIPVMEVLEQGNRPNEYQVMRTDPQTGTQRVETITRPGNGYPFTLVR